MSVDEMNRKLPRKLNKSPLIDAVFETRISSSVPMASFLPGLLMSKSNKNVGQLERLSLFEIPSQLRQENPQLKYLPTVRIDWGDFYVSIGDLSLIVSCKYPYPGWTSFRAEIYQILSLLDTAILGDIERYSLRYVNIINATSEQERLMLINLALKIGSQTAVDAFGVRLEFLWDDFRSVVQVASPAAAEIANERPRTGTLVDIDCIKSFTALRGDEFLKDLPGRLDRIHAASKSIFYDCLTDIAVEQMEPLYD